MFNKVFLDQILIKMVIMVIITQFTELELNQAYVENDA